MLGVFLHLIMKRRERARNGNGDPSGECCRTCLSTIGLEPIFDSRSVSAKTSDYLMRITGLEIKMNDGLPQKMCNDCISILNDAIKFRKKSQKSHTTLVQRYKSILNPTTKQKCIKKENSAYFDKNLEIETVFTNPDSLVIAKDEPKPLDEPKIEVEVNPDMYDTENDLGALNEGSSHFNDDMYTDDVIMNEPDPEPVKAEPTKRGRKKMSKEPVIYKCNECNKEFQMRNPWKAHMRTHTNFCVCELCGKKCRNNNLLLLHKRGKHGAERVHKCSYCDYSSANKEGLVIHERRHTGEKPYVCDHCGASFHRRSNLVQHIAIHLPDKNFQCELCSKKFRSKKFLRSHKFKQHQEKRYTYLCHVCKNHFRTTDAARKHLTRAHGVPREAQGPVYRIPNVNSKCVDSTALQISNLS